MAKYNCPICNTSCTSPDGCFKHKPRKTLNSKSSLKRGGKLKSKSKSKEQIEKNKKEIEKQWKFFLSIWNKRPHKCQITGKWLGDIPYSWMFDHLLPKASYKNLKYEEDNIILCSFEVHERKTNGFPDKLHQELIDKAKEKFLK